MYRVIILSLSRLFFLILFVIFNIKTYFIPNTYFLRYRLVIVKKSPFVYCTVPILNRIHLHSSERIISFPISHNCCYSVSAELVIIIRKRKNKSFMYACAVHSCYHVGIRGHSSLSNVPTIGPLYDDSITLLL